MESRARAFAEEAIRSLGRGDAASARNFVALAVEVDHHLDSLADCVYLACAEIDSDGEVTTSTWDSLADAVGSVDLWAVVESSRG